MLRRIPRRWLPGLAAFLLCLFGAGLLFRPPAALVAWQERVFDAVIQYLPSAAKTDGPPVIVIDFGALDERGEPWSRAASARLAHRIAKAEPAVIAFDMVFSGNCGVNSANQVLTSALSRQPAVLGFLLSGSASEAPRPAPMLGLSPEALPFLWPAPGAEAPCPAFAAGGATLGAMALQGDGGAVVRKIPAAVVVAGTAYPSLAIETLRRAGNLPPPVIGRNTDGSLWLRLGRATLPLEDNGSLRFTPTGPDAWKARTLAAAEVLKDEASEPDLKDAIVIVGSSLPLRGGLRPTAASPLHPSVQIAADAVRALQSGSLPHRPRFAPLAEALALALAGLALILIFPVLPSVQAFASAVALGAAWAGGALTYYKLTASLLDPSLPGILLVIAALAALLAQAAATSRAEKALHQRLDQLLPPAVIARLLDNPKLLRLKGEQREVTALTTDLEGFSRAVHELAPEQLIELLDSYFALVSRIVLRHGGMIDKFMGDGVHALFNAPLDQPGHPDHALAAAAEIAAETEAWRKTLGEAPIGRTRIGVETGPVILGDIGSGAKIDYTALGAAVNLAARLQEAGKALGTTITIGPATAARASARLKPLGSHDIRSFGRIELFTLT